MKINLKNLRMMNVKLRRIDVDRLCTLLVHDISQDETEWEWLKDVYNRLEEQLKQFDKKLEEEDNER